MSHANGLVKATSPAHITGFFMAFENGSTGAGVNLENGMTTTVSAKPSKKNSVEIKINGKKRPDARTSRLVVQKFLAGTSKKFAIKVSHKTRFPIGYGLGISGAGALSLSIALNKALGTRMSKQEVLEIAKQAEIEAKTGLGDVVAQQFSGIMVGLPPFPSTTVHKIVSKKKFVVCGFFGPIQTKKVLSDKRLLEKINSAGKHCMEKILEKKTVETFEEMCRFFSIESTLATPQVKKAMQGIPNSAQAMLGSTVFKLTDKPTEMEKEFKKYCTQVIVSRIASKGAHLL